MKNNYPTIVCWRITSECNRKCPFCFRPERKSLSTDEIYKIVDNLAIYGVKGIGITGGEPLIRKDFVKILKYIWEKDIKICLATNLDFYFKYKKPINKYVSTIGIPIEGSTKEIHDFSRGVGSFNNIIAAIDNIYKNNKLQMYFSTVLTRNNIGDLINIENLLAKYRDKIAYWKIYNIVNYSDRLFQSLKGNNISETRIKKVINALGKKLGKKKVLYLSPNDRSEASLLINPDGEVIVPVNKKNKTKDFILGNLLKDNADIIFDKWGGVADYDKYVCHKCALKCVNKSRDLN